MALGEMLGEARGKVAVLRALGDGIIEVSLQGKGTLLGSEMEDVTTFGSAMRPNGTAYGQGYSIQMSTEGMAEWRGSGVGKVTAPGAWRYSYGGVYTIATPDKWQRLLNVYTAGEYEADANGNYHWKLWEWKY
ncbi:MAG TPA: hypothetical protein VFQ47_01305 [Nitrososphaera sp.]|jgi:hypothetical protein|nr:hypothetical protein [Nitrososphaera sp.]